MSDKYTNAPIVIGGGFEPAQNVVINVDTEDNRVNLVQALNALFEEFDTHQKDLYQHLGEVEGASGKSKLFQEDNGGGIMFTDTDGNIGCVAVNDGSDGVYAQLYYKSADGGTIYRLNVTPNGIYYGKEQSQPTADDELVVKKTTDALSQKITALETRVKALEDWKTTASATLSTLESNYSSLSGRVSALETP